MSMVYAATYPARVRRLVLCGTFARFSDEWREAFGRFLAERENDPRFADAVAARRLRQESPPDDAEELGLLALRGLPLLFGRYGEKEQAFLERAAAADAGYHVPALTYFNERVAPTLDLRPLLPRIEARTLVLTGELDPWGAGAAAGARVADPGRTRRRHARGRPHALGRGARRVPQRDPRVPLTAT